MTVGRTPRVLAIAGAAVAAIVLGVATVMFTRPLTGGPLQPSSDFVVRAPLSAGEELSWGLPLPFNQTSSDARIRSVVLEEARGLVILGIIATYGVLSGDGTCVSGGAEPGFPPKQGKGNGPLYPTGEIAGATVPARQNRTCENHPAITVGVRRASGSPAGEIRAIRVRYTHAGAEYETILPWSLVIEPRQ
jgi:hypothetical protein